MEMYKKIDSKISTGYRHFERDETGKACDAWLDAWADIKTIMEEEKIRDIPSLEGKYEWTEFLSNYAQDLEQQLYNAGLDDETYISKRLRYCEEMLQLCGNEDRLLIENTRRAIADSHYALGSANECDRLYSMWLTEDPIWGWGYIGWADCYSFGTRQINANYEKAEELKKELMELDRTLSRRAVVNTPVKVVKVGRNEPCPCGSGQKYKKCCGK